MNVPVVVVMSVCLHDDVCLLCGCEFAEIVFQSKVMKQKSSESKPVTCYGSHIGLSGLVHQFDDCWLYLCLLTVVCELCRESDKLCVTVLTRLLQLLTITSSSHVQGALCLVD